MAGQDSPETLDLFHSSLDLVELIARQVGRGIGQAVDLDELLSFGREGLLDAARRFEPGRGVPFRAYASYRVRGAIIDGVRALSRLPRRAHERLRAIEAAMRTSEGLAEDVLGPQPPGSELADAEARLTEHMAGMASAIALGLVCANDAPDAGEHSDPESALARAELLARVKAEIDNLEREEAELVRRHYLEGERFDHVARELGLSKSWASRLHTRAVARLSKRLRASVR